MQINLGLNFLNTLKNPTITTYIKSDKLRGSIESMAICRFKKRLYNDNNYDKCINHEKISEIFNSYNKQNKKVLKGLVERREKESLIFLHGDHAEQVESILMHTYD